MKRSEKMLLLSLAIGGTIGGLLCYWGSAWWFGGIIGLIIAAKLFDALVKSGAARVTLDSKLDSAQPVEITAPKPEKKEA